MTGSQLGPWVEGWLSAPRLAVYLSAVGGDRQIAVDLYEWNSALSAAFMHDLGHLEVALRNAYDAALTSGAVSGRPHWTQDAARYFPSVWRTAKNGARYDVNDEPRHQIARAVGSAGTGSPGKAIAELTFGFWRYLSSAAHEVPLWRPYLHRAFLPGTSRATVDAPVTRLHKFRNRVAHHEPLLRRDRLSGLMSLETGHLTDRCDDGLSIAGKISVDLRGYVAAHSQCSSIISQRPTP
ncbi:MAG: hypothetical protein ACR2P2_11955 [Nakamurella sp.]